MTHQSLDPVAARDARPESFPHAATGALANQQVRANIRHATTTIRRKRAGVVAEVPDWEVLRAAGSAIKDEALASLDSVLVELEASVQAAGGTVHWARDAAEANEIVVGLVRAEGAEEVVKVKSLATDEIRLNEALEAAGIRPIETDLAELIVQLAGERPSHLLVPAIHKNRREIRDLFRDRFTLPELTDEPAELAEAARLHLREAFLRARVAVSGANFAAADTGTICVVESEGNGRMCTTLPDVLITVMGIEKAIPRFRDLEVFLQLLPRSSTGRADEPVHIALDGCTRGRRPDARSISSCSTPVARACSPIPLVGLRCAAFAAPRASTCAPSTGRPVGTRITRRMRGRSARFSLRSSRARRGAVASLPFASSLCGACYDVCPVLIDIPSILVHERGKAVARERAGVEGRSLKMLGKAFATRAGYERAQRLGRSLQRPVARDGWITHFPPGPLGAWGRSRDLPALPAQTFREWWESRDDRAVRRSWRGFGPRSSTARARRSFACLPLARRARRRGGDRALRRARAGLRGDGRRDRTIRARPWPTPSPRRMRSASESPSTWAPSSDHLGVELVEDVGLSSRDLDALDGAVTTCRAACAETGTIALDGGPGQGRRALSLVPDLHVCVVRADAIVETVPELIAALEPSSREGRPIVLVSGPSATSDIELTRVEGVHGPRRLVVVVAT